ncbi:MULTISPECIES: hypothetical protein [Massilia]|uniref:Putative cadmium resistance factor n=1 Tax=Massilia timonae TaxID=47229 RepID=A0A1S2NE89_9BURK|nr:MULTISPECIES: hypothetical protein [Massilia]OIJ43378.1 putative cadmium resistance factor [Massilia timonae]
MTRRILSCLLLMLAFQFTWSAISAYCMHETGAAAKHLGHHQHKQDDHEGQAAERLAAVDDGKTASGKKTAAHTHCASCVHAVLAPAAVAPAPYLMLARLAPATTEVRFASVVQLPPERPQWRAAV